MKEEDNSVLDIIKYNGIYIHDFDWDKIYYKSSMLKKVFLFIKYKIIRIQEPVVVLRFRLVQSRQKDGRYTNILLEKTETTLYRAIRLNWYKWFEKSFDYEKVHDLSLKSKRISKQDLTEKDARKLADFNGHNLRYSLIHKLGTQNNRITFRMVNQELIFDFYGTDKLVMYNKTRSNDYFGQEFFFHGLPEYYDLEYEKFDIKNYETNTEKFRPTNEEYLD